MCPTPPVYDQPYADGPSTDPGGFVSLGRGYVTNYNQVEDNLEYMALGGGSVFEYDTVEDAPSVISENYSVPGAIGNPVVVFYEKPADSESTHDDVAGMHI